jgi:hypothetical protein
MNATRPPTFQERLLGCLKGGNLTVADLARWFNKPHPTVRGWTNGFEPRGTSSDVDFVFTMLTTLETLVRKRFKLPIAPNVRRADRIKQIDELRRAVVDRISKKGAA